MSSFAGIPFRQSQHLWPRNDCLFDRIEPCKLQTCKNFLGLCMGLLCWLYPKFPLPSPPKIKTQTTLCPTSPPSSNPSGTSCGKIPSTRDDGQRIEHLARLLFLKIMDNKAQELELLSDDYVSPIPAEYPDTGVGTQLGGEPRRGRRGGIAAAKLLDCIVLLPYFTSSTTAPFGSSSLSNGMSFSSST